MRLVKMKPESPWRPYRVAPLTVITVPMAKGAWLPCVAAVISPPLLKVNSPAPGKANDVVIRVPFLPTLTDITCVAVEITSSPKTTAATSACTKQPPQSLAAGFADPVMAGATEPGSQLSSSHSRYGMIYEESELTLSDDEYKQVQQ